MKTLTAAVLIALASAGAQAQTVLADGTIAMNQAAALAGGVNLGDAPGFPITIAVPGTYRLTSNLVVPNGVDAIQVVGNVSAVIDLNGYQIVGSAVCNRTQNCWSIQGTAGVRTSGSESRMKVMNGEIRGFSFAGIGNQQFGGGWVAYGDAIVQDVRVVGNGAGVMMGRLIATRMLAEGNSRGGIFASTGVVADSQALQNGGNGIEIQVGTVRGSASTDNGQYGFRGSYKTLLDGNSASGNAQGSVIGGAVAAGANAF